MAILVALVFAAIVILGVALLIEIRRLGVKIDDLGEEWQRLRLQSRARVSVASMQSGETSNEQVLRRLGRASAARRVVFGGDDDSQLNHDLHQGIYNDNE